MKKTIIIASLLVGGIYANAKPLSYYMGVGSSQNNSIDDSSFNIGFNGSLVKNDSLNLELEIGLSMSDNDNNFLDLLPEISYDTSYGSFSALIGVTVGYVNNSDVLGSTIGAKYTTPFENHNMQVSYKKSSLETGVVKLDDIDRYSINYIYKY